MSMLSSGGEAWRAVVEFQVFANGQWQDRRWVSKNYDAGSNGPMGQANRFVNELTRGQYFEGSWRDKNLVHYKGDEITVLAKYKEESTVWRQI